MSDFRLQIVNKKTGDVANWWDPRDRAELDLAEEVCKRLKARGRGKMLSDVGLFASEEAVCSAIKEEFDHAVLELKKRVRPSARP